MPEDRYQLRKWLAAGGPAEVIVIGASTGGPDALTELLRAMPPGSPPVVVVQHIAPALAHGFAERLARNAGLRLGESATGVLLQPDTIYLALDARHIGVRKGLLGPILVIDDGPPVSGHRPSVDYLFSSMARARGESRVFAALLTGMGRDGAEGLKSLLDAGAFTVAQDEASCAVYGMPKEAVRLGAVKLSGSIPQIRQWMEYATGLSKYLRKAG
jgi:two-component system chemotaxis response regulator CheB